MGKFPLISIGTGSNRQGKNTKHVQLLPTVSKMEEVPFQGTAESTTKAAFRKSQLLSSNIKYNTLVKIHCRPLER